MKLHKYKEYAPLMVRIGISLVVLWFGFNQVFNPAAWTAILPKFLSNPPIQLTTVILINGFFEITIGTLLLLGLFTRIVSVITALHLLSIIFILGYNPIAVRDFGLMLAAISVFLNGPDKLCLDKKFF